MKLIKTSFLAVSLLAGSAITHAAPVAAPLGLSSLNPDVSTFDINYEYVAGNAGTVSYDGGATVRNVGTFSVNVGVQTDFFVNGNDDYVNPNTGNNLLQISNGEYSFSALIDEAGVFVSGGAIRLAGNATEDGSNFDAFEVFLEGTISDFGYNGGLGDSSSPAVFEFLANVTSSPDPRISFGNLAGVIIGESSRTFSSGPIDFSNSFSGTQNADTFRVAEVPTPSVAFLMLGGLFAMTAVRKAALR